MTRHDITRRGAIAGLAAALAGIAAAPVLAQAVRDAAPEAAPEAGAAPNLLRITKDPTCGCCGAWADLAREAGFEVEITETKDYAGMKAAAGVPEDLWSCHTARIGGYVVEGHVPFAAIRLMLEQRPDIVGIAVPGMPGGSPGMGGGVEAQADVTAWGGVAGKGQPFPMRA